MGSTTSLNSPIYIAPASTSVTGTNNYYFTYLARPATTGSTSGSAYTMYIENSPSGSITNPYSLYIATGKTYIGGELQIPTGAQTGYILQSDATGNSTWVNPTVYHYVSSTSSQATTSTTPVTITGMTFTITIAGIYFIKLAGVGRVSNNNRTITLQIARNGTLIPNTNSAYLFANSGNDTGMSSTAIVSLNINDVITGQFFISSGTATMSNYKSMVAIKL